MPQETTPQTPKPTPEKTEIAKEPGEPEAHRPLTAQEQEVIQNNLDWMKGWQERIKQDGDGTLSGGVYTRKEFEEKFGKRRRRR